MLSFVDTTDESEGFKKREETDETWIVVIWYRFIHYFIFKKKIYIWVWSDGTFMNTWMSYHWQLILERRFVKDDHWKMFTRWVSFESPSNPCSPAEKKITRKPNAEYFRYFLFWKKYKNFVFCSSSFSEKFAFVPTIAIINLVLSLLFSSLSLRYFCFVLCARCSPLETSHRVEHIFVFSVSQKNIKKNSRERNVLWLIILFISLFNISRRTLHHSQWRCTELRLYSFFCFVCYSCTNVNS